MTHQTLDATPRCAFRTAAPKSDKPLVHSIHLASVGIGNKNPIANLSEGFSIWFVAKRVKFASTKSTSAVTAFTRTWPISSEFRLSESYPAPYETTSSMFS
jgi:hypothetical protein